MKRSASLFPILLQLAAAHLGEAASTSAQTFPTALTLVPTPTVIHFPTTSVATHEHVWPQTSPELVATTTSSDSTRTADDSTVPPISFIPIFSSRPFNATTTRGTGAPNSTRPAWPTPGVPWPGGGVPTSTGTQAPHPGSDNSNAALDPQHGSAPQGTSSTSTSGGHSYSIGQQPPSTAGGTATVRASDSIPSLTSAAAAAATFANATTTTRAFTADASAQESSSGGVPSGSGSPTSMVKRSVWVYTWTSLTAVLSNFSLWLL